MDTELARTFLTVVAEGNFISAADKLNVSQSTVSTRIHTLEDQLRCTLFVRNKSGTALTPAGHQFQKHATALVRTVEQARHDIGIPEGFSGALTIGGRIGLWEEFLLRWLPLMQASNPSISIRADSALESELMPGLIEGRLDVGVMYTPQSRPGLQVEQLFDERLVMVSTNPKSAPEPQQGYVYVDWGPEFYTRHSTFFPNFGVPSLTANIGWLGLQHLMSNNGSGYFPLRIVRPHIEARRLHIVEDAPEFSMPAYVVYPLEHDNAILSDALAVMHRVADAITRANRSLPRSKSPGKATAGRRKTR